jgi:hypothetical protein
MWRIEADLFWLLEFNKTYTSNGATGSTLIAGFCSHDCNLAWPAHDVVIIVPFSAGGTTDRLGEPGRHERRRTITKSA